jgi:hypothetical protein
MHVADRRSLTGACDPRLSPNRDESRIAVLTSRRIFGPYPADLTGI